MYKRAPCLLEQYRLGSQEMRALRSHSPGEMFHYFSICNRLAYICEVVCTIIVIWLLFFSPLLAYTIAIESNLSNEISGVTLAAEELHKPEFKQGIYCSAFLVGHSLVGSFQSLTSVSTK